MKIYNYKHKIFNLIIVLCIVFTTLGCAEVEEEPVVVIDSEPEGITYDLVDVSVGDIVLTKSFTCKYVQTKEQEIAFSVGGKRVDKVHVRIGDSVKKGDVLIELATDGLKEQIDEVEYRIAKNELLLSQLDEQMEFDKQEIYFNFIYNSNGEITDEDVEENDERNSVLEENYSYKREDYEDAIEFDKQQLNKLKNELATARICSSMDGVIHKMSENLEGSTAKKGEVVMTIVDNANGLFEANEPTYASSFQDGEMIPMKVVYGDAMGEYTLTPHNISSWNDTLSFSIVEAPENEGIEVGTSGTITIVVDQRSQVLCLPRGTVYTADGKSYVYVLNDENMREVRWVEIGLEGDDKIEIVSGLQKGDQVVKK
ncbi:MAG: efflux RND transporter periplasmic adaptor subunit [Lachnospiraceae bacterium]|nr:efflux RND transporter periplasmic adaptor subunit [Lachnospiraceae bacterium]